MFASRCDGESFTSSPYLVLFIYEELLSTILHISLSGSLICIFMGYNLPGFITSGTPKPIDNPLVSLTVESSYLNIDS